MTHAHLRPGRVALPLLALLVAAGGSVVGTHPASAQEQLIESTPAPTQQVAARSGSVSPVPSEGIRPMAVEDGWRVTLPGGFPLSTPAVVDGVVYIGGGFGSHEFYALDAATGAPRWAIQVSDDGPTTAVVKDGLVAFNTESCTLFIVRAQDGGQVWSRWLGDPLMSQPAIANDRVFMVYPTAATHRLAAFELRSGNPLWEADLDTDAITAPVVVDGDVYVSSQGGNLYRFDGATGRQVWMRPERVTSAPWIAGDRIFAAMHDETAADTGPVEGLGYLSRDSGDRAQETGATWSRQEAPWLSRDVQRSSSYGGAAESYDNAVGFKPGLAKAPLTVQPKQEADPSWQLGAPEAARIDAASRNIGQFTVSGLWGFQGSRPTLVGDLAIATVGDTVRAVDVNSGEERWAHALGNDVQGVGGHLGTPPAYAGGRIYVAMTSGDIIALEPTGGTIVWRGNAGGPVRAQPVIVGGRVYVGTESGQLVMLDTGHRAPGDWPMWGGSAAHQ